MLEDAGDEPDLLRRVHGEEGGGGAAEVVQRHGLPNASCGAPADGSVEPALAQGHARAARPRARHGFGGRRAAAGSRRDSASVGKEHFRHRPALRALGLGVLGEEQQLDVVVADSLTWRSSVSAARLRRRIGQRLRMAMIRPSRNWISRSIRPVAGRLSAVVHQRDAEVERLDAPAPAARSGPRAARGPAGALQRLEPGQSRSGAMRRARVVEVGDRHGDRGGAHSRRRGARYRRGRAPA